MKYNCPFCSKKFDNKATQDHHVTLHVVENIRQAYPGLLETIEKVENEMSVKFLVKVDVDKVSQTQNVAKSLIENMEKEDVNQSQSQG